MPKRAECIISWSTDDKGQRLILDFNNLSIGKALSLVQSSVRRGALPWSCLDLVPSALAYFLDKHAGCTVRESLGGQFYIPIDSSQSLPAVKARVEKALRENLKISVADA